jgi:hypothetical protein
LTRTGPAESDSQRSPSSTGAWPFALLLLGLVLFLTNSSFTLIDDEVQIFTVATQPAAQLVRAYWSGAPPHPHPPLFDLLLHVWLRATSGDLHLLRVPSILFYIAGIWFLALAAARLAGAAAFRNLLLIGLFWPYGFHFGRLAVWYSFCFLLVALLTHAHLRLREKLCVARWVLLVAAALALVYSNYFGWPMIACLALDFLLEQRGNLAKYVRAVAATLLLLVVAYFPLWRPLILQARSAARAAHPLVSSGAFAGFAGYVLFVSESVAPWFWWFGVPALLAIVVCLGIVALRGTVRARRFLLYFLFLFAVMAALGILTTKRAMLVAPWLLLPLAMTLAQVQMRVWRWALALSLAAAFAIGWCGVLSRRYYAAPRFIEPWAQIGREAARGVQQGALVIGNHPSLFFYLTAALQNPSPDSPPHVRGVLTFSVFHQQVYQPEQWVEAGRPVRPTVFLVQGVPFQPGTGEMEGAQSWLSERCQLTSLQRSLADPGYQWKRRFLPELGQAQWRIEVRRYSCPAQASSPPAH